MKSCNLLLLAVLGTLFFTAGAATSAAQTNFTISVAVSGLTGTLVVQDNNGDSLTFTANNTQTFATSYASGSSYTVSVQTQPGGQTCTLSSNATGTITANTTVTATCVPNFTISVAVTGLTGGTLVVQDSKAETLSFTTNTTQTFATAYASGSSYTVTGKTQPEQQCQRNHQGKHYGNGHLRPHLQDQRRSHRPDRNTGHARQQGRHSDVYVEHD